jgi:hypothetical protein
MFSGGEKNHFLGLLPVSALPPNRFSPSSYFLVYLKYGRKMAEVRPQAKNPSETPDFLGWSFA